MEHSSRWAGKMLFGFDPANCTEHFGRPALRQANQVVRLSEKHVYRTGLELDNAPDVPRCIVVEAG
jgi:hypothetical protein